MTYRLGMTELQSPACYTGRLSNREKFTNEGWTGITESSGGEMLVLIQASDIFAFPVFILLLSDHITSFLFLEEELVYFLQKESWHRGSKWIRWLKGVGQKSVERGAYCIPNDWSHIYFSYTSKWLFLKMLKCGSIFITILDICKNQIEEIKALIVYRYGKETFYLAFHTL